MKHVAIHSITPHAASAINTGDSGELKMISLSDQDTRIRVSSQCSKRAQRTSPEWHQAYGGTSIRTRLIPALAALIQQNDPSISQQTAEQAVIIAAEDIPSQKQEGENLKKAAALGLTGSPCYGLTVTAKKDQKDAASYKKAVTTLSRVVTFTIEELVMIANSLPSFVKFSDFPGMKAMVKQLKAAKMPCMDVALAGRMTTNGVLRPIDGALTCAHSISINSVDAQYDYFIAADDLNNTDGGAGHLGSKEMGMPVLFGYATISISTLKELTDMSDADVAQAVADYVEISARVYPGGHQATMASHARASYVLVTVTDTQPVQPTDAFIRPCQGPDLVAEGIKRLSNGVKQIHEAYGDKVEGAVFCLPSYQQHEGNFKVFVTMADLKSWIVSKL